MPKRPVPQNGPCCASPSFHHQPEAQHPKISAIHKNTGRLPHLLEQSGHHDHAEPCPLSGVKRTSTELCETPSMILFRTWSRGAPHASVLTPVYGSSFQRASFSAQANTSTVEG